MAKSLCQKTEIRGKVAMLKDSEKLVARFFFLSFNSISDFVLPFPLKHIKLKNHHVLDEQATVGYLHFCLCAYLEFKF
jgi:hypothetical protein